MPEEMVTVTKTEYERLLARDFWLGCLEEAGVDNWQGIDEAKRIKRTEQG
jgi:phage pi2 protein 07